VVAEFASVADIADFLQVEISTADQVAYAERALREASAAIRNYCRQEIGWAAQDTITLDCSGGARLFLPQLPVIAVASVIETGQTLAAGDDYKLGQHGILHRIGRSWMAGVQTITVTYSHGYAVIPDDILAVCTRAASRSYQAGLRSADTGGAMGISSKALGDFSVSYQAETAGGGAGEGVMGASAARLLLRSEKEILNRYRV
jgi:hypothetical protein